MSAFEVRPERPPHSPFCLEVYIFALSSLEDVTNKRPLWLLERNKNDGTRSVCRTVALTTSARAPSQVIAASRNLSKKCTWGQKCLTSARATSEVGSVLF
jgi:hypothetical protein